MEELIACKKAVSKVVSGAPNVSSIFIMIKFVAFGLCRFRAEGF